MNISSCELVFRLQIPDMVIVVVGNNKVSSDRERQRRGNRDMAPRVAVN